MNENVFNELYERVNQISVNEIAKNLPIIEEWTAALKLDIYSKIDYIRDEFAQLAESANMYNEYPDVIGVRENRKNGLWIAEIRHKYVTYQLGYHGEGKTGYESAVAARKEAESMLEMGFDFFSKWYKVKYPDYTPINRAERGYKG